MSYSDDLKLPEWQRRRLEIMNRDGWRCVACGNGEAELNVHHRRYHHHGRPWNYADADLETLCEPCHTSRHNQTDIDVTRLGDDNLRDFIAFAIETEDRSDDGAEKYYMATKQSQAWFELFSRKTDK